MKSLILTFAALLMFPLGVMGQQLPQFAYNEQVLKQTVSRQCAIDVRTINAIHTLKRSIDARQRTIFINLTLRVFIGEEPPKTQYTPIEYYPVDDKPAVIVVGAGPGGLFAALHLIELGLRPIVIERGKNVRDRKLDIYSASTEPAPPYCPMHTPT